MQKNVKVKSYDTISPKPYNTNLNIFCVKKLVFCVYINFLNTRSIYPVETVPVTDLFHVIDINLGAGQSDVRVLFSTQWGKYIPRDEQHLCGQS